MKRENFTDLLAFVTVCREGSFTKAAAQLGVSPSAISHAIRKLEERLGLQLLNRTTRSVSPTETGERLLASIAPRFDEIDSELAALSELRKKPAGNFRITTSEYAASTVLWPALAKFLPHYPDIHVELVLDSSLTNIVAERYDAGVRLGENVAKDMIAVRIAPDMRMAVVGTPSYFEQHPKPRKPQDLTAHRCINLRMQTHHNIYAWEFEKGSRELKVRVEGQVIFSNPTLCTQAALDGIGLAYLPQNLVQEHIDKGTLIHVLADWCAPFSGLHFYYPAHRQRSPAFALLVNALRYREA